CRQLRSGAVASAEPEVTRGEVRALPIEDFLEEVAREYDLLQLARRSIRRESAEHQRAAGVRHREIELLQDVAALRVPAAEPRERVRLDDGPRAPSVEREEPLRTLRAFRIRELARNVQGRDWTQRVVGHSSPPRDTEMRLISQRSRDVSAPRRSLSSLRRNL